MTASPFDPRTGSVDVVSGYTTAGVVVVVGATVEVTAATVVVVAWTVVVEAVATFKTWAVAVSTTPVTLIPTTF
jgi:hypothetical protein